MSAGEWAAIVGLVIAHGGAVVGAIVRLSGRIVTLEVRLNEVVQQRLDDYGRRIDRLEERQ